MSPGLLSSLIQLSSVLLLAGIAYRYFNPIWNRIEHRFKQIWQNDSFCFALKAPIQFLIAWVIIRLIAVHSIDVFNAFQLGAPISAPPETMVSGIQKFVLIGLITWFFWRLLGRIEWHMVHVDLSRESNRSKKNRLDRTTVSILARLVRIVVLFAGLIMSLNALSIDTTGLVAVGGVSSFMIGFAAKDLLSNLFGGMMIFMDRSFSIGDWICLESKKIEGTVEQIGWRSTRIRKFDKRPLYVPNALFLTEPLENPSRMSNRQIKETFGLRYQDASVLPKIVDDIEKFLLAHPEIDSKQILFVQLTNFSTSALNCQIYCFTKTIAWVPYLKVQQSVFLSIIEIITKHGAEISLPTQPVLLAK